MAKRPRFSRWRRLPPVFRTGENRPIGSGNEQDRIILYLPSRMLDLAEALATKAGVPAVQDYCSLLLTRAIDAEQIQQRVSGFERRHGGTLEGLKEIAEDSDYLLEWQARSDLKHDSTIGAHPQSPSSSMPHAGETITVDLVLGEGDNPPMDQPVDEESHPTFEATSSADQPDITWEAEPEENNPLRVTIPNPSKPPIRVLIDRSALEALWRHVGMGDDDAGFLPCLRRGIPVPANKVSELIHALNRLEQEHRGASMLDRRMSHALHRLALESQVLLTDAWPGVFDDRMITAIRSVQEAVERILSGQDIRYYSNPSHSPSE